MQPEDFALLQNARYPTSSSVVRVVVVLRVICFTLSSDLLTASGFESQTDADDSSTTSTTASNQVRGHTLNSALSLSNLSRTSIRIRTDDDAIEIHSQSDEAAMTTATTLAPSSSFGRSKRRSSKYGPVVCMWVCVCVFRSLPRQTERLHVE